MEFLLDTIMGYLASLMWPFSRVAGMFTTMALISTRNVPARVRLLLAAAITVAVQPGLPAMPEIELFSLRGMLITGQEAITGMAIGFASQMLLTTFIIGGQVIGMQTSLGFASMVDPINGQQVPVVAQFFLMLSTLVFIALDGHLAMFRMVISSFHTLPVGTPIAAAKLREMVHWGSWMFATALAMSMSAIISLLLINFSFGVMTRAAPQLNIFSIGFPITMLSGLLILWLTMGSFLPHFLHQWQRNKLLVCEMLSMSC